MKVLPLIIGDIRFQYKYGFYFVYAVFTLFYIIVLNLLPEDWIERLALVMIFSDPTAFGLFFMGAIIHLEMSEKTIDSIYVAPVTARDYLIAKLVSLSIISLLVGLVIGISVQVIHHPFWFVIGLVLGSMIFSTIGMIAAFKSHTLNQFFFMIIPTLIMIMIPGTAYVFFIKHPLLLLHPGIAMLELLSFGPYVGEAWIILMGWFLFCFRVAHKIVWRQFTHGSAVRL